MNAEPSDPTIQTPLGPGEDEQGVWRVSLAEIDAMCRKAARGAGYTWGMAEEAGRAARWLAAYRQPGPEALAELLVEIDGALTAHSPRPDGPQWHAPGGGLCPIGTGAALSDRAEMIRDGARIALGPVLRPLLVVPFLCRAARDLDCHIALEGPEVSLVATPEGPATEDWAPFRAASMAGLEVKAAAHADAPVLRHGDAAYPLDLDVWRALDRFAHRTYAPATASSRAAAGSGATQRDND